jgi:hypothetical protein
LEQESDDIEFLEESSLLESGPMVGLDGQRVHFGISIPLLLQYWKSVSTAKARIIDEVGTHRKRRIALASHVCWPAFAAS